MALYDMTVEEFRDVELSLVPRGRDDPMWFDSWSDIGRVLAVGTAAYLTLIVILRLSGQL